MFLVMPIVAVYMLGVYAPQMIKARREKVSA